MTNAIHAFQVAKSQLGYLKGWRSLIGSEYHGGGGGIGEVVKGSAVFTIYHQPSNGATNYHDAPSCQEYINQAAKYMAISIIDKAISLAESDLNKLAQAALIEAQEVVDAVRATP